MSAARNLTGAAVLTGAIVLTGLISSKTPPAAPSCVRKVPDAGECLRWRAPGPGEEPTAVDPGDWNRFPAEQARGDCELVECVVSLGEAANP